MIFVRLLLRVDRGIVGTGHRSTSRHTFRFLHFLFNLTFIIGPSFRSGSTLLSFNHAFLLTHGCRCFRIEHVYHQARIRLALPVHVDHLQLKCIVFDLQGFQIVFSLGEVVLNLLQLCLLCT